MSKKSLFGLGLIFALILLPSLALAAPATPTLISPSNNAKNYNHSVTTLYWSKISGDNIYYEVEIRTDNNAFTAADQIKDYNNGGTWYNTNNYVNPSQVITSTISAGLELGKTYFWHVRACDTVCGNWSQAYKFTTAGNPAKPSLISPKVTSKNSGTPVVTTYTYQTIYKNKPQDFKWSVASDVIYSEIQVYKAYVASNTSAPTCSTVDVVMPWLKVSGNSVTSAILNNINLSTNGEYYCWDVKATNNIDTGAPSDHQYFRLKEPVIDPSNIFAQAGFGGALFYWTKTGGINPTIQVSTKESFADKAEQSFTDPNNYMWVFSGTLFDYVKSKPQTTLFWRVKTADSGWSKAKIFKSNFLKAPVLSWPKGQTITATSSVFKWSASPSAKFYKLEVSEASAISSLKTVYLTTASYKIPTDWKLPAGVYKWTVTAFNDFGQSDTPGTETFTAQ